MKFIKLLFLFSGLSIILNSCSSLGDAGKVLRNEKTGSQIDEFLIKKKSPLTQPPDYSIMPEPGSVNNKADKEQNSFKNILEKNQSKSSNNKTKSSPTEEAILNQIKK